MPCTGWLIVYTWTNSLISLVKRGKKAFLLCYSVFSAENSNQVTTCWQLASAPALYYSRYVVVKFVECKGVDPEHTVLKPILAGPITVNTAVT